MSSHETRMPAASAPRAPADVYHILMATDGSPASLGAVRFAAALAHRTRATVHALVLSTPYPHVSPSAFEARLPAQIDEDNRRAHLETARTQLADVPGTESWALQAAIGWPSEHIVRSAERWPASLVVVGAGEHGPLDRLLGVETALAIARHSHVPMVAVPATAFALPTHAVVGIDFTDASEAAARSAASLLGTDGLLTLLHASTLAADESDPGSMTDVYTAGAREKLDALRVRLHRETHRRVDVALVHGTIAESLLHYVAEHGADLLALGGHPMGLIDRLLLGSVRSRVLRHAPCPVLVVPPVAAME